MLRMRRADDDQETRMLTAMLDATGRISAVARQASELALWHEGEPPGERVALPLTALLERVAASSALPRPVAVVVPPDVASRAVDTRQVEPLVAAVAALVVSAQRNAPDAPVALRALANGSGVRVAIGREDAVTSLPPEVVERAEVPEAATRLFAAGGQGLSLILASSVLDRHGISVGLIESSGVVVLRLPKDRGHQ
jgi:hypothetical protein